MNYDRQGRPIDLPTYCRLLGDPKYKRVALDQVRLTGDLPDECGDIFYYGDDVPKAGSTLRISTVWLGSDHCYTGEGPPVIFETMVFVDSDIACDRYCTLEEAEAGHAAILAKLSEWGEVL